MPESEVGEQMELDSGVPTVVKVKDGVVEIWINYKRLESIESLAEPLKTYAQASWTSAPCEDNCNATENRNVNLEPGVDIDDVIGHFVRQARMATSQEALNYSQAALNFMQAKRMEQEF